MNLPDVSGFLVLATGGMLVYLASKSSRRETLDGVGIPAHENLLNDFYMEPTSDDLYFRALIEKGVPPVHASIGMYGIPTYYYPRAGGKGLYKVTGITV